ncbi:hypothetical protein [Actinoplanes solisilvae]|uniref:hypothetical protein n=1 Tax=Actinoplanes solisilvae TaxID=2486853 RepID=UPI000FDBA2FC|nr:hypothetical protein [Actinoplanes solisilvae]
MTIVVSLQGATTGEGFLIAPLGAQVFHATLSLHSDADPVSVTLRAAPDAAGLVFSESSVEVTTAPTAVRVHATAKSVTRADTIIEVVEGDAVLWSMPVTCIANPTVHFRGRFQARFATQPAFYNSNPMYTPTTEDVGPGWTWALEGEPPFVEPPDFVPERVETPVGRQIRFNDPLSLRSHAAPVVTTVDRISGLTHAGIEEFTAGDPMIGEPADLGPNTYFAGNRDMNPAEPTPEEFYDDAREPFGLFEVHLGDRFSGASAVGPFTHKATFQNEHTRIPDSRPIANGLVNANAELIEFGLPDLRTFSETRLDLLVLDYEKLPPDDSPERRNLARRIGHLLAAVSPAKSAAVLELHPDQFEVRVGTLRFGWNRKEVFVGKVDAGLRCDADGSPVIGYFGFFTSFTFETHMFAFHSDELCAHHISSLSPDATAGPSSLDRPALATLRVR